MLYYVVCWTETDGIYSCEHEHSTIAEAMGCLVPDGRTFIRAWDQGQMRSLNDAEAETFFGEVKKRGRRGVIGE
jgi:hypothetical protein